MDLRRQAIRGSVWAAAERFGTQALTLVTTVILARLLTPSDFGTVGMLGVFIAVAQLLVDSGIGDGIIRRTDRSERDFSTMFWFNLAVAIGCYGVLFAIAPIVAGFYGMPVVCPLLRVVGLVLISNALFSVQVTRLTVLVDFKTQAKVAVGSCVISGAVGIVMALRGWGVWALACQTLAWSVGSAVAYWILSGWRPGWGFSGARFGELWRFGAKLMAANFLGMIYDNLAPLVIGKSFGAAGLGFYSRGSSIANLPGSVFQSVIGRVSYPILADVQDDAEKLRRVFRRYAAVAAVVVVPAMAVLCAVARALVGAVLGEQWLPCVPYLRILAVAGMFQPFSQLALRVMNVKGRSDLTLRMEAMRQALALAALFGLLPFGIYWLCIGMLAVSAASCVANVWMAERTI